MRWTGLVLATLTVLLAGGASALAQANCRNTGNFERWLADFKREAAAKGISPAAINAASPYLVLDQRIINIDRGQRFFAQNSWKCPAKWSRPIASRLALPRSSSTRRCSRARTRISACPPP